MESSDSPKARGVGGVGGLCLAVALVAVALLSALLSVALMQWSRPACGVAETAPLFSHRLEWSQGERIPLNNSAYDLHVAELGKQCYLLPKGGRSRTLVVAEPSLSPVLVSELGGLTAEVACGGGRATLLRRLGEWEATAARRERRAAGMSDEERARRMQGLALPREQREPRCMDTFIDCGTSVGTVHKCYTGLNGIFLMEQECVQPTQFQIRMVKPPGRILKILQKQMIDCVSYKRENAQQGRLVRC